MGRGGVCAAPCKLPTGQAITVIFLKGHVLRGFGPRFFMILTHLGPLFLRQSTVQYFRIWFRKLLGVKAFFSDFKRHFHEIFDAVSILTQLDPRLIDLSILLLRLWRFWRYFSAILKCERISVLTLNCNVSQYWNKKISFKKLVIYTNTVHRKVLADLGVFDWWHYCKALWDVKFRQIEGNGPKLRHIQYRAKQ